jgi:hypothetical protein
MTGPPRHGGDLEALNTFLFFLPIIVLILGLVIAVICGILVGRDAAKRGMNPWAWGIFVALIWIIGLPMYLTMRKPLITKSFGSGQISVSASPDTKKCPYCAEIIKAEAIKCKHCGSDLSK